MANIFIFVKLYWLPYCWQTCKYHSWFWVPASWIAVFWFCSMVDNMVQFWSVLVNNSSLLWCCDPVSSVYSFFSQVFCASCCSLKCKLLYMDRKEARVCVICHSVLMNGEYWDCSHWDRVREFLWKVSLPPAFLYYLFTFSNATTVTENPELNLHVLKVC